MQFYTSFPYSLLSYAVPLFFTHNIQLFPVGEWTFYISFTFSTGRMSLEIMYESHRAWWRDVSDD